jgi:hypothetical protein
MQKAIKIVKRIAVNPGFETKDGLPLIGVLPGIFI